MREIIDALESARTVKGRPTMVVTHTIKGKGVSFMEATHEWPDIFGPDYEFSIGRAATLRQGKDLTIFACGVMTSEALQAADILAEDGIQARVVNMSTIKPIDKESIITAAEETGAIVTAENHNILGGLGSAVAEVLVENRLASMARIGIRDVFGETGSNQELLHKYGMSAEHIAYAARKVLERKEGL